MTMTYNEKVNERDSLREVSNQLGEELEGYRSPAIKGYIAITAASFGWLLFNKNVSLDMMWSTFWIPGTVLLTPLFMGTYAKWKMEYEAEQLDKEIEEIKSQNKETLELLDTKSYILDREKMQEYMNKVNKELRYIRKHLHYSVSEENKEFNYKTKRLITHRYRHIRHI